MQEEERVLLYDGVCGFCNKSVQFVLNHDRKGTMRFAPLQGSFAKEVLAGHPELVKVDSLVLYEKGSGRVRIRSEAALAIASYLGGIWKLGSFARIIPRAVRDYFYDLFARYRYRWFGKYDTCAIPPREHRARFLD